MSLYVPSLFRNIIKHVVFLKIMAGFSLQCVLRPVLNKVHLTAIQDTRVTTMNITTKVSYD